MHPELDTLISDMAGDLKELVSDIEASPKFTQNHYGRYMAVLAGVAHGDSRKGQIVALALIRAGANPAGVQSALNLSS